MPPNFNDSFGPSPVNFVDGPKDNGPAVTSESSSGLVDTLKAVRSLTTLIAHMLIGIVTGVSILFAYRNGAPLNALNTHIVLSVVGYQFLMAEAILCLAPDSWLSTLRLKHKRWIHWILQIAGSAIALAGCFIMILEKDIHWNTLHGQFGLVAMVFTTVSLVNGVTSMYAYEIRRIMPGILSKLTHILFGIVAMAAASISLAYGFDKGFFRNWATTRMTDTIIIFTATFTTIVIINPFITFFTKLMANFSN